MDASDLLEWDTESLAKHQVRVVGGRVARTHLADGNSTWELIPKIVGMDGSMPQNLAVEFELRDDDGIVYATASHALHSGNGPKLKGVAVTRVIGWSEHYETPRVTVVHARVIPGAPHPTRKPLSIPISFDADAMQQRGHTLENATASCSWHEWSGPVVKVATRSLLTEGALAALSIYAIDRDGMPFSHNLLSLDPDPEIRDLRIGFSDWAVAKVPDRITMSVPDREFLTRVTRAWDLAEFEEY